MRLISWTYRQVTWLVVLCLLLAAPSASADDIKVMTSGAFTAALLELVPQFERTTHHKVITVFGASMGGADDSIPVRLARGETADILILSAGPLEDLLKQGKIVAGSRVDLARSSIGMGVRSGTPKTDIST